jgi:peptidyl-prolyl cis-trans isomerase SurA
MSGGKSSSRYRHWAAAATFAAALTVGASSSLLAQQVVVVVNGDPVTAIDVAQRSKLIQLSTHKVPQRQEIIDELIDEKLKLQIAKRYRVEITEAEVNNAFGTLAARARTSPQQFAQGLAQAGISSDALKAKLKADIIWSQIIRGKFQSEFNIRERDIVAVLEQRSTDAHRSVGYEYTLRPILFIVQRGSPEAIYVGRKAEADALRARFQRCDEGLAMARGIRDVAVRDQIVRSSADVPAPLREVLDKVTVGSTTPAELTQQGIEFFAVCGKKESGVDAPARREVRDEMMQQRFLAQAKRYLAELRRTAMIEYR